MRRAAVIAAAMAVGLLDAGSARADAAGDAILARVDAAMNRARTLTFDYEITNHEASGRETITTDRVKQKGEKTFTEYTSGELRGTKVLILSPTQMYVYLPSFGKVRRIASHTRDAGFLGMTFSQDDLATTRFGSSYTAVIAGDEASAWKLVLTPKPGQDTPYAKIQITVTKDRAVPSELLYFDAANRNVKTETRTGYSCEGDVCTPGERRMTDNVAHAWTKLVAKSRTVNAEISDDVFSQRNLGE